MVQQKDKIFQICIGVLLGDGTLQKNTSKSVTKYRLKFLQGGKDKEYVYHLHKEFKGYVRTQQPYFKEKRNTYSFQTRFHEDFCVLAECILINEMAKKVLLLTSKRIQYLQEA